MHGRKPFDPSRLPFFYGWVILIVGAIGMMASFPGQTAGVSVFTDHLTTVTGLDRLQLSYAYLMGTGASGLLLPRGGRWIDLVGTRVVAFGATIGLAITLTAMSFVGPMTTATGLAVMTLGFAFMRFCGQGMLTLSSRTMVSRWFEQRRGLLSSVVAALVSALFASTPLLLHGIIDSTGFRNAWRLLAICLALIVGTVVLVFFRNLPEDCGLEVDGASHAPTGGTSHAPETTAAIQGATRSEALRDMRFWIVTLPVASLSTVGTALTFHIVDFGRELGMDESSIVRIFIPVAAVSIPISLISGFLADRIPVTFLGLGAAAVQIVMYLTVPGLNDPSLRVFAVLGWGAGTGCFSALTSAALPRLFGRAHLGSIAGAQMSAMVIGSAIGPALFALIEQSSGSYRRALQISLVGPVATLVLGGIHWSRSLTSTDT